MPTSTQENNKRIAKNTAILYCRMFLMMVVGLFTSRVVLQVLGVSDYGIYNAVGGFVALFSLLSGTLTNSVNRFLTFELGRGDTERLKRVFCTSLNVMFILSAIVILAGATLGVWFLQSRMNIPAGRMEAATWVLGCSVLTFAMNLISVPYNAAIVAHERMTAFAYISLIEATVKLLIAYALYIIPFDKLTAYALMYLVLALFVRLLYGVYCKRHFSECTYTPIHDRGLLRQMTSFAGWNFLSGGASILNNAGVNVLINLYFGVTVNAARGIATQVNGHVTQFVTNFMMAVNPQITKSYAQEDYAYMHGLICRGAKFSFYLMLFFLIPICLETHQILYLWLGVVPDYAVPFVQLTLVATTLNTLSGSLITGLHATGNIRNYMIVVGCVELTMFPVTYVAFKLGASPLSAYYIYLSVYFILMLLRLYLIKGLIHMKAELYVRKVYLRVFVVALSSCILPSVVHCLQQESIVRFLSVCCASVVSTAFCVSRLGLDSDERAFAVSMIKKRIHLPI